MDKAKQREREHEIIYEKKLLKERSKDDHLFADKEKFVTSAYKKKLAEQAKWLEEERLRQIREEKDDVSGLNFFFFNQYFPISLPCVLSFPKGSCLSCLKLVFHALISTGNIEECFHYSCYTYAIALQDDNYSC